jgi:hypothetical protein
MISTSFGRTASHGKRAPGDDATHTRPECHVVLGRLQRAGQTQEPPGVWEAPIHWADPSAT